jgi:hypothetical protein
VCAGCENKRLGLEMGPYPENGETGTVIRNLVSFLYYRGRIYSDCYTEATERSPVGGGDNGG